MKNLKLIGFLMILASSLMFIQCTSDPIPGTAGIDGIDGTSGLDGIDGLDGVGVQECVACHSNTDRDAIHDAYALSKHAIETTMYDGSKLSQYGNRAECAACHTNQGFIDRFDEQDMTLVGPYSTSSDQSITCTGCHTSHRSFDFANDGNDYALRTLAPVQLVIDPTVSIDSKNDADVLGYSNTCVNCHQPRTPAPTADVDGNANISSTHWGPHHGPQGTMLEGLGGASFLGQTTALPARGTAGHKTGASCVTCHMGEPTDVTDGSHTWNPTANACLECHDSEPEAVEGLEASRATLLVALQAKGVFDADGGVIPGTYPAAQVQAAFNYLFVEEDKSNGIHNPDYAKALVANSIEALQ
jgi:hypothetical protein